MLDNDPTVERQDGPSTTEETAIEKDVLSWIDKEEASGLSPTLAVVKRAVNSITTEAQLEQVLEALVRVQWLKRVAKDLETQAEEAILFWLVANGVPGFTLGETYYYAGTKKTTRARDNRKVLEVVVSKLFGDLDGVADQLQAQPWKHGAVKTVIGEELFGELFEVREEPDLKTGKPVKRLQGIPKRYLGEGR